MNDPKNPAEQPQPVEVTEVDGQPTPGVDEDETSNEQPATTAGQQNHSDPGVYRGDDADAPADTGNPAQEG